METVLQYPRGPNAAAGPLYMKEGGRRVRLGENWKLLLC